MKMIILKLMIMFVFFGCNNIKVIQKKNTQSNDMNKTDMNKTDIDETDIDETDIDEKQDIFISDENQDLSNNENIQKNKNDFKLKNANILHIMGSVNNEDLLKYIDTTKSKIETNKELYIKAIKIIFSKEKKFKDLKQEVKQAIHTIQDLFDIILNFYFESPEEMKCLLSYLYLKDLCDSRIIKYSEYKYMKESKGPFCLKNLLNNDKVISELYYHILGNIKYKILRINEEYECRACLNIGVMSWLPMFFGKIISKSINEMVHKNGYIFYYLNKSSTDSIKILLTSKEVLEWTKIFKNISLCLYGYKETNENDRKNPKYIGMTQFISKLKELGSSLQNINILLLLLNFYGIIDCNTMKETLEKFKYFLENSINNPSIEFVNMESVIEKVIEKEFINNILKYLINNFLKPKINFYKIFLYFMDISPHIFDYYNRNTNSNNNINLDLVKGLNKVEQKIYFEKISDIFQACGFSLKNSTIENSKSLQIKFDSLPQSFKVFFLVELGKFIYENITKDIEIYFQLNKKYDRELVIDKLVKEIKKYLNNHKQIELQKIIYGNPNQQTFQNKVKNLIDYVYSNPKIFQKIKLILKAANKKLIWCKIKSEISN